MAVTWQKVSEGRAGRGAIGEKHSLADAAFSGIPKFRIKGYAKEQRSIPGRAVNAL